MPDPISAAAAGGYNNPDVNRLIAAASNSPASFQQNINAAQGMQTLSSTQFDLAHKQLGAVNSLMSTIAQNPTDDVIAQAGMTARNLGIPANVIAQEIGTLAGMDPSGRRQYALGHIAQNAEAASQIQMATGSPTTVNDGGRIQFNRVNPLTNQVTPMAGPGAVIPTQLSPQDKVQRQSVVGPTGQTTQHPVGDLYDPQGNFIGIPVARGGQRGAPAVSQVPPPTAGPSGSSSDTPPAPQAQAAPSGAGTSTSAAPARTDPSAGMTTALSPSAMTDRATSTTSFADARNDISPSRDRVFGLVQAIGALRNTTTGVGTETRQNILGAINALPGGIGKTLVPDSSTLSDYDVAKKYLSGYQLNRPGATRSDAGLANAQASSPNVEHMTNSAATETALNFLGQERMKQAQTISYINSKRDPGDYANVAASEFGKSNDPKAYALGAMTQQERAAYFNGLKGPDKAKFLNSVRLGLTTGVLSKDDLQGASGGR